jgi:hypothetical protein
MTIDSRCTSSLERLYLSCLLFLSSSCVYSGWRVARIEKKYSRLHYADMFSIWMQAL